MKELIGRFSGRELRKLLLGALGIYFVGGLTALLLGLDGLLLGLSGVCVLLLALVYLNLRIRGVA